jgi:hypothetical protein
MALSGMGLIAILLAAFLLAAGLVRLLSRLIDSGAPDAGWAGLSDANGTDPADAANSTRAGTDPGRPR